MKLRPLILLFAIVSTVAVGCTSDDPPPPDGSDSVAPSEPSVSPLATEDLGEVPFEAGVFRYRFDSVSAELRWEGGDGELTVDNGGDRELGAPGLYAVTSDQREVPAEVTDSAPIEAGASVTLPISFPDDVAFEETGFVVLLFGDENWGAFSPVPVDEA